MYLPVFSHVTPHDRSLVATFFLRIRTCSLEKNQSWNEPKFSLVYFLMAVAYGYAIRAGSPCGPLAEVYPFFSRRGTRVRLCRVMECSRGSALLSSRLYPVVATIIV